MRRRTRTALVTLLVSWLLAGLAAVAGAQTAPPQWNALTHQFDYQQHRVRVTEVARDDVAGALVHDITYQVVGQDPVAAYLVTPTDRSGPHPAVLFLHWLDTPELSTRAEFLDEAESLAAGPDHVVSLLPQLDYPFAYFPVGDVRDKDAAIKQVIQLRRGLDLLDARPDVDPQRVAVVGHDYGAMYATMLSAIDRQRVHATVVMAADATMSNWFVKFFLDLPDNQVRPYRRMLAPVDPINYIGHDPRRMLLQYARNDFFIPLSVARRMRDAAGWGVSYRTYDADHSLDVPAARSDRDAFLHWALAS